MNSDRSRGGTFRKLARFAVLLGVTLVIGFALRVAGDTVRSDFQHDIVWYRYGAPLALRRSADRWYPWSAPLLDRWTQSGDPVRVAFAESSMARLGGWPARRWLDAQIARDPSVDEGSSAAFDEPAWRVAFGLDDPARRQALVNAALAQRAAPAFEAGFDAMFLAQLKVAIPDRPAPNGGSPASVHDLIKGARNAVQAKEAYLARPLAERRALLMQEADTPSRDRAVDALLVALAADPQVDAGDRVAAAAVLHSNGDRRFDSFLRAVLNGKNLQELGAVSDFYVALKLAKAFANTRYVRAMKAYDAIRGGFYFGDDRDGTTRPAQPAQRFARALKDEIAWRGWLRQYPDHPGADDATYWLVRALEMQARRVDALTVLSVALTRPVGDGDMYWQLWSRFLYLLDVGTKDADLDAWLAAHQADPMEPFVAYARAVRYARAHQYGKAVELSAGFAQGARMFATRLAALPRDLPFNLESVIGSVAAQRVRWHRLADWVIYTVNDLHPELREMVIDQWQKPGGWTIPYLALYDGGRMGGDGPAVPGAIEASALAANYRHASALATSLALTLQNLGESNASPWTRERDRYRVVALLYEQATQYPDNETIAMHPLPGFPPSVGDDAALYVPRPEQYVPKPGEPYYAEYMRGREVGAWYVRQAIVATRALIAEFPKSTLADSALMCLYEMSGDDKYLKELLQAYPDGDRAEEARAALYVATHPAPTH